MPGPAPTPIGIRVPRGGSCCANCVYVAPDGQRCRNQNYVMASFLGKRPGDSRFIDGKTGRVITDPFSYCCNFFDW